MAPGHVAGYLLPCLTAAAFLRHAGEQRTRAAALILRRSTSHESRGSLATRARASRNNSHAVDSLPAFIAATRLVRSAFKRFRTAFSSVGKGRRVDGLPSGSRRGRRSEVSPPDVRFTRRDFIPPALEDGSPKFTRDPSLAVAAVRPGGATMPHRRDCWMIIPSGSTRVLVTFAEVTLMAAAEVQQGEPEAYAPFTTRPGALLTVVAGPDRLRIKCLPLRVASDPLVNDCGKAGADDRTSHTCIYRRPDEYERINGGTYTARGQSNAWGFCPSRSGTLVVGPSRSSWFVFAPARPPKRQEAVVEIQSTQSSPSPLITLAIVSVVVAGAVIVLQGSESKDRAEMIRAMRGC